MDGETYTAASTRVIVNTVSVAATCVQLCAYDQGRLVLILSVENERIRSIPLPPGVNIDLTSPLPSGVIFPLTSGGGGMQIFTFADHGPLVQSAWISDLQAAPPFAVWTVIEVIDLQLPCAKQRQAAPSQSSNSESADFLSGLSGARGGGGDFSLGTGYGGNDR